MTTEHDAKLTAAFDAKEAAGKAYQQHRKMVGDEVKAAAAVIEDKHRARGQELLQAQFDAAQAFVAVQDATPAHPWTGKRVWRMAQKTAPLWARTVPETRVEGVVEMMTSTTELPANLSKWRTPGLGQPIVRLAKADGTLGKSIEPNLHGWQLVEGQDDPA